MPTPSVEISVLTLVRNRQTQLDNFLRALRWQTGALFEVVIASMQPEVPAIEDGLPFPVRVVSVPGTILPLAAARNRAAYAAQGELLIFLDIDCIAAPGLVANYARALRAYDACLMGEVRYLPAEASVPTLDYLALSELAIQHPARPAPPADGLCSEDNPRMLWGLSFALRRNRFFAAGGLDAGYTGYGGEETDFALRLAAINSRFAWLADAQALHQWHSISRPPLNHFREIIANAQRFRAIWGSWCLEYWLDAFVQMGLIEWSNGADRISLLREPTAREVERALDEGSGRSF
ncbi:glycosyltransferase family 2 protein [Salinisphaera aquimarina]|uniref:Glycosyltransferase family 2 protein n=1 Tax=Salinisphaera aquimarina TaxID=2094031 RepID=A0ABV7ESZ2_9GAMM